MGIELIPAQKKPGELGKAAETTLRNQTKTNPYSGPAGRGGGNHGNLGTSLAQLIFPPTSKGGEQHRYLFTGTGPPGRTIPPGVNISGDSPPSFRIIPAGKGWCRVPTGGRFPGRNPKRPWDGPRISTVPQRIAGWRRSRYVCHHAYNLPCLQAFLHISVRGFDQLI